MADYELIGEVNFGHKPKEHKESDGDASATAVGVGRAIQHGRPETIGPAGALHLQRAAGNAATGALVAQRDAEDTDAVHKVVGSGGGSSLDGPTRTMMESRMGHDFGDVRVHSGPDAAAAASSVQAQAFTVGNDVVLGAGKSASDERTMAHELTHVVQQRNGPVPGDSIGNGISLSDPGDWAERQAESNADAVMSTTNDHAGHDQRSSAGASVQTLPMQRQDEPAPDEPLEDESKKTAQAMALQRAAPGADEAVAEEE